MSSTTLDHLAPSAQIVVTAVLAAVVYGVLHDQITARVCVEYFTIGHPPVFQTADPTLLGLGWGVIATWWVGLLLGLPLAFAARRGARPKTPPSALWKPIGLLLLCMGACALIAGVLGYVAARSGAVLLLEPLASRVPRAKHTAYLADLWAHTASYGAGFLGGLGLVAHVWHRRGLAAVAARAAAVAAGEPTPSTRGALTGAASDEPALADPEVSLLPPWAQQALRGGAQLTPVLQLFLLYFAALTGLATILGTQEAVLRARLFSGVLAFLVVAFGALAWKFQGLFGRLATVLLSVPALWLCVSALSRFVH